MSTRLSPRRMSAVIGPPPSLRKAGGPWGVRPSPERRFCDGAPRHASVKVGVASGQDSPGLRTTSTTTHPDACERHLTGRALAILCMGGAISPRGGGRRGQFAGFEVVTGGSKKRRGQPDWQRTCRIATDSGQLHCPDRLSAGLEVRWASRTGSRAQSPRRRSLCCCERACLAADSPAEPAALRPAPSPRTSLSIRLKDGAAEPAHWTRRPDKGPAVRPAHWAGRRRRI
jgi:hypothetical protein